MQCSIIGSFRKYYEDIVEIIDLFEDIGISILSPKKSYVTDPDREFVFLESDDLNYTPVEIQLIAFNRILRSNFVYVYCPHGYIGRTTAYEIGRVVERQIPIFFSDMPKDLPIFLPCNTIWDPNGFSDYYKKYNLLPKASQNSDKEFAQKLNNNLFTGKYHE